MKRITFIINPISGFGQKKTIEKNIEKYLDPNFELDIQYTKAPKHATELSAKASQHSDIVVAVGGDGSIHEVAQALVGKTTKMGIIPMGSGNGLARHLQIPRQVKKAIELINIQNTLAIDVLDFGDIYGINVAGVGFDAHVAHEFSTYGKRGFISYIKLSLKEFFKYQPEKYNLVIDGVKISKKAFLISLANSTQFGNNAYIAPKAVINDGLLDLAILSPFSAIQSASIGLKLFTRKVDTSSSMHIVKAKEVNISSDSPFAFHIDGEPTGIKKELNVKIKPSSLNIIVP